MTDPTNEFITQLFQAKVAQRLQAYQGNLAFAVQIVQNGWLPAEDEPGIQQLLEILSQYLADIGYPEDDRFLLRLGLTVPGMQRGIMPPLTVLDKNRGGFSARRQREAEGQIRRLSEGLAIGRRFMPSLSPNTQQAVAELASWLERQSLPDDQDWLNWFNSLSSNQAEQVGNRAMECLDSDKEPVREIGIAILQDLACFRYSPLSEACCRALIERAVVWPASLYRDSGDGVAAQLIARIEVATERNHLLLALAWTHSDAAFQAFRQWTNEPPPWALELHVPPAEYLHSAGWCLDTDGRRRNLTSSRCFRLLLEDKADMDGIRCRTRIDESCPSCGGPLSWLFDFTPIDADYFPSNFAEAPRRVLCCLHCAVYGHVFSAYRGDGTARCISQNGLCDFPYDDRWEPRACIRTLSDTQCPPSACAEPFTLNDATTLGGMPMWLQDASFPRCIECGCVMTFLAQHDNSPLGEEGIYYAFFCAACHVAAVGYQQT